MFDSMSDLQEMEPSCNIFLLTDDTKCGHLFVSTEFDYNPSKVSLDSLLLECSIVINVSKYNFHGNPPMEHNYKLDDSFHPEFYSIPWNHVTE